MYVKQFWILAPGPESAVIDVGSGDILGICIGKVLAFSDELPEWSNLNLLIQNEV